MNSEQTNELAAALAKAQGAMENAKLNKANPYFKSKYADLASVIDAIKKPLADNGLGYMQITVIRGTLEQPEFVLHTILLHSSGQSIRSEYPLPMMPDKPQVMGSAITYARRYALAALCGVAAEEDDDANAAQAASGSKKPPKPAPDIIETPHDPKTGEIIEPPKSAPKPTPVVAADAIDVQDMAREAAMRGRAILNHFYGSRNTEEKDRIKEIMPELKELVAAVEAQMTAEEGS
jgi:hypothetical protein